MLTLLALATAPAQAGFAPTFSDNFDAYESSPFHGTTAWVTEFPPSVGGDGWMTQGIGGVRTLSAMTGGTWGGFGDPADNILHAGVSPSGDVRIDVKVDYANDTLGYGNAMGVVWRYTPASGSYYMLVLSRTNGTQGRSFIGGAGTVAEQTFTGIRLIEVSNGAATLLVSNAATSISAGSQQALRVDMVGTRISVFFDNNRNGTFDAGETYVSNFNDTTPLPPGEVGLFAYGAGNEQATFDDFVVSEGDVDNDLVADLLDNCVTVANPSQVDTDSDSLGDACDPDDDDDGVSDGSDNCSLKPNPNQFDLNNNGRGDVCDDSDGDSWFDDVDNCTFVANASQGDVDGDGVGDACDVDPDGDGYGSGVDCDETRADVNPGSVEVCDGVDQNCDNDIDDLLLGCIDFDRDGAPNAIDCDDTEPNIRPGAPEQCNSRDDDCDGLSDEDVQPVPWYRDQDGDGHGAASAGVPSCTAPAGAVWRNDDCVDSDVGIYPGADETCDGRDNDCDAVIDTDAVDGPWYKDLDHDGFGVDVASVCSTQAGATYTQLAGDCNDNNAAIVPGHVDLCDGVDEDCDGTDDEDAPTTTYYIDNDGDSWGWSNDATDACSRPAGYAGRFGDCDDFVASVNPDEIEIPGDGIDQDCDGEDPSDPDLDADSDGLSDGLEEALGLDPSLADSDGDGVDDLDELGDMTNPTDSDGDGWIDADDVDDDGDGVLSSTESSDDTDGDGISDRLDTDSDGDGVVDGAEQGDADGDGLIDALDVGRHDHPTPEPLEDLGFGCMSARGPGALGAVLALLFARRRRRASVRP